MPEHPSPVCPLDLPLTADQQRTLYGAVHGALSCGSDCVEETALLEELADALSPGEVCTLSVNALIWELMEERHPVERETPYWCQATDRVRRVCTSALGS